MYDLDEVFSTLNQTLDNNLKSAQKDFWMIFFQFWKYFYSVNQNIAEAREIQEKIRVIESFVERDKILKKIELEILEAGRISKKDLPGEDLCKFSPHIQNMKELWMKEQARLNKAIKDVKKEKGVSEQDGPIRKKRPIKQKWIRS
jgi:hypothetical protein